jgi:hypothetical protein
LTASQQVADIGALACRSAGINRAELPGSFREPRIMYLNVREMEFPQVCHPNREYEKAMIDADRREILPESTRTGSTNAQVPPRAI